MSLLCVFRKTEEGTQNINQANNDTVASDDSAIISSEKIWSGHQRTTNERHNKQMGIVR